MLGTTNASGTQASMDNLNISINGTNVLTYDGKNAKSLDISLSSLGAAARNHTHDYLPLTGGTLSGILYANGGIRIIHSSIPYIDFHFNKSPTFTSNIYENQAGTLIINDTLTIGRNQGSLNVGNFHIHNGELNKYYNNTAFTRDTTWKELNLNSYTNANDFGFSTPKWSGNRIQRYTNSSTIDTYKVVEDVYTHTGNFARCNNINLPNEGAMYFSEPDKYIFGDIGGWLCLGYHSYVRGKLVVYGDINIIGNSFAQDSNLGGIVAMQATGPNVKMLWAW